MGDARKKSITVRVWPIKEGCAGLTGGGNKEGFHLHGTRICIFLIHDPEREKSKGGLGKKQCGKRNERCTGRGGRVV